MGGQEKWEGRRAGIVQTPGSPVFLTQYPKLDAKIFRDSEYLVKSNGKKWSQILNLFNNKGCKIAAQKKVCFWANLALLSRIYLVSGFLNPFNGLFAPTSKVQVQCQNF